MTSYIDSNSIKYWTISHWKCHSHLTDKERESLETEFLTGSSSRQRNPHPLLHSVQYGDHWWGAAIERVLGWEEMCLEYQVHIGFQRFSKKKRLQIASEFFKIAFILCKGEMQRPWRRYGSQRITCESWFFFFPSLRPRDWILAVGLSGRPLYPLSHLTGLWAIKTCWQNVEIILWHSGLNKMSYQN